MKLPEATALVGTIEGGRVIYIEDTLYTTSDFEIISYNLNTLEEVKKLNLNN